MSKVNAEQVAVTGQAFSRKPGLQERLALLGTLAALTLRSPEELGQLAVTSPFGVLDVGLQPQRVAQALLGEPPAYTWRSCWPPSPSS
jgi:hypothetical protein